jgi:DEAD/DEAH box helicase domain-containing protein
LSRAIFTIYEGAVFLHRGNTYLVKNVDHDRKLAKIQSATIEYTTRQRDFTNVDGGEVLSIRQIKDSDVIASYGTVKITSIVFGYFKADRRGNILDTVDISTPPFVRFSTGFWIDVPRCALDILASKNIVAAAAIHASEHALMSLTMVVSMTSEGDVQTECKQGDRLGYTRPSRIILYDASGKSSGVCAKAFDHVSLLLDQAMETIENCRCEEGCPACAFTILLPPFFARRGD